VTETAYYVHIVLALRLPGVIVGYYLRVFAFCVQGLTTAGFHNQALTSHEKFEFHKSLEVIGCCLVSPSKSGGDHTHLVVSLAQPFGLHLD